MPDELIERPFDGDPNQVAVAVTPRVLVFFDYSCQFCYLDWPRFKRLRAQHGAELFPVPFELRPSVPAAGVPLSEIGAGHSERVEEYMRRMAREAGISLVFPAFVPNTHHALALGEFSRDVGPETHEAVHEAIFSAYSAGAEDIGSEEVLLRIAEEHSLDSDQVAASFADGRYDERLHQFRHLALELGISATPSALICNELVIGTRPYEVLQASLERCLVTALNIADVVGAGPVDDEAGEPTQAEGSPATIDR